MELALSPVLILSFDPVHMNVAHSMGLFLLMASVTLFTKRFLTEKSYSIAAISLLAMPVVVFAASAMKSDLYTAVFVCGVIFFCHIWSEKRLPPFCRVAIAFYWVFLLVVVLGLVTTGHCFLW